MVGGPSALRNQLTRGCDRGGHHRALRSARRARQRRPPPGKSGAAAAGGVCRQAARAGSAIAGRSVSGATNSPSRATRSRPRACARCGNSTERRARRGNARRQRRCRWPEADSQMRGSQRGRSTLWPVADRATRTGDHHGRLHHRQRRHQHDRDDRNAEHDRGIVNDSRPHQHWWARSVDAQRCHAATDGGDRRDQGGGGGSNNGFDRATRPIIKPLVTVATRPRAAGARARTSRPGHDDEARGAQCAFDGLNIDQRGQHDQEASASICNRWGAMRAPRAAYSHAGERDEDV